MDMNDDQILTLLIELKSLVAGIATKLDSTEKALTMANTMLLEHERRLTKVETERSDGAAKAEPANWKDGLIQMLVKGLVAAILTIGSLTGASALIKQVWSDVPAVSALTETGQVQTVEGGQQKK